MRIFGHGRRRRLAAAGAAPALLAVLAANAFGIAPEQTQTREGYVDRVEPICKQNTRTIERTLKGSKRKIRHEEVPQTAPQFTRAAAAYERAVKRLAAVPPPPADAATLKGWVTLLSQQSRLLRRIAAEARADRTGKISAIQEQLVRSARRANRMVLGFGFRSCEVDSSKFT